MSIAFGVPNRRPSVHTWAFEQDDGHLLVAERDGRVIATGASIGFGSTGLDRRDRGAAGGARESSARA
jgi:hypothetical protein